jgi:hypothetical protein
LWRSADKCQFQTCALRAVSKVCSDTLHKNRDFSMLCCSRRYQRSGRILLSPHATFRVPNLLVFNARYTCLPGRVMSISARFPTVRRYTDLYDHAKQIKNLIFLNGCILILFFSPNI